MIRIVLFLIVAIASGTSYGQWQHQKCNRSYQTHHSTAGWSIGCYKCHSVTGHPDEIGESFDAAFARMLSLADWQVRQQSILNDKQAAWQAKMQLAQAFGFAGGSGNYSGEPYAQQGSTVYGYQAQATPQGQPGINFSQTSTYSENWGDNVDLMSLYTQLGNAADSWRDGALSVAGKHSDLVGRGIDLANRQLDAANTLAQGQANAATIAAVAKMLEAGKVPPGPNKSVTVTQQLQSGQQVTTATTKPQPAINVRAAISGMFEFRCRECHNPTNAKGGIDLTAGRWQSLNQDQWARLKEVSRPDADPQVRMPKNKPALSSREAALLEFYEPQSGGTQSGSSIGAESTTVERK